MKLKELFDLVEKADQEDEQATHSVIVTAEGLLIKAKNQRVEVKRIVTRNAFNSYITPGAVIANHLRAAAQDLRKRMADRVKRLHG